MGSIPNSPSGLSYLTQPGALLSALPGSISTADLQSASPQDLVSLSLAAIQTQEVDDLFGMPTVGQSTEVGSPIGLLQATEVLPGVAAADLANASPPEQAAINSQALLLQEVQGLFAEEAPTGGTVNLIG
jgi:hypothetical protein